MKPRSRSRAARGAKSVDPDGPPIVIIIQNRQRVRSIKTAALKECAVGALRLMSRSAEICIHLASQREMAELNWRFLQHEGSTDVITFDQGSDRACLRGEIFISVGDAVSQAAEFGATWQSEVARYVIHGLLHLDGFDDLEPGRRATMKRHEERLLRGISGDGAVGLTELGS